MKIVFMGTPEFAVPSLEQLVQDGHQVAGVFTQPDKPKGRGYKLMAPPVKEKAQEYGIPVYQPEKMRDGEALKLLRALAPELIVVVAYGKILPKEILQLPPKGCINVHGSLLPKYRGAGPIQWAVINGEKETGITTMHMAEGLDTGDILLVAKTPIGEEETAGELFDRLAPLGADCLKKTVQALAQGRIAPVKQDESKATNAPMLNKEMAVLDFTKPAQELYNLIRGLNPWPVAVTEFQGKRLKVFAAQVQPGSGEPGTVLDAQQFVIACGQDALRFTEVQLEGSRRISAEEFLRGKQIIVGKSLTGN